MNLKRSIQITSLTLLIALFISYFFIQDFNEFVKQAYEVLTSGNRQKISEWVSRFGVWGPVLVVLSMIVQRFPFV